MTFTTSNYNTQQQVTFTAEEDNEVTGFFDVDIKITLANSNAGANVDKSYEIKKLTFQDDDYKYNILNILNQDVNNFYFLLY